MLDPQQDRRQLHEARGGRSRLDPNVAETREYLKNLSSKGGRSRYGVGDEVDADDLGAGILGGTDIPKDEERSPVDDASPPECAYAYGPHPGERFVAVEVDDGLVAIPCGRTRCLGDRSRSQLAGG
jgi:hypothetical protein